MRQQRSPQHQQTLNKSLSLFQSGRFDKAEKLARSVLASEPRNAELLQFIALICQSQEKYADAEALCARAVAVNPHSVEAHYNLGTALMKRGRAEQAVASFRRSLALAPHNYDALNNLAITLSATGDITQAQVIARQAITLAPHLPLAHNTLGLALIQQMLSTDAVESFKAALACAHPDPGHVLENLGSAYLQAERPNLAIDCFQKA